MQKQIELTDKTVLVVGLPEESLDHCITHNAMWRNISYRTINTRPKPFGWSHNSLPDGDWQLVGIHPELTEEECKMIVEQVSSWGKMYWPDYRDLKSFGGINTAKEAFDTLMQKLECYTFNHYSKPELQYYLSDSAFTQNDYEKAFKQWQQAEQSTFPKFAVLIRKNV